VLNHFQLPRPAASKTPRVDLKKLIASPEDFVGQMAAVLDADSVSIFSKLAKRVAAATGMRIDAGTVHSAWALKYFFQVKASYHVGNHVDYGLLKIGRGSFLF